MTAPKETPVEVANSIKIDRKLPPHELNARRRRKRNLMGKPIQSHPRPDAPSAHRPHAAG